MMVHQTCPLAEQMSRDGFKKFSIPIAKLISKVSVLLKAAQFLRSTMQLVTYLRLLSFLTTLQNDGVSLRKLLNLLQMMSGSPS